MKVRKHQVEVTYFQSEVMPHIKTKVRAYKDLIQWADDTAYVWDIVTETRSLRFGASFRNSSEQRVKGQSVSAVLARLKLFYATCMDTDGGIATWNAHEITLKHYADQGFSGGIFHVFDDETVRSSFVLDYTPDLLEEVLDQIEHSVGDRYSIKSIALEGKMVRIY